MRLERRGATHSAASSNPSLLKGFTVVANVGSAVCKLHALRDICGADGVVQGKVASVNFRGLEHLVNVSIARHVDRARVLTSW